MKIGAHDLTERVFVIAEIGNNHEGDRDTAQRLIEAAALAGADAVKFQAIVPEQLVTLEQKDRLAQLNRICLPLDAFLALERTARDHGVTFLCTPFCEQAVDFLAPLVPAWKIASGDIDHEPLLARCAATRRPMILSTGACDVHDARRSVAFVRSCGSEETAIALLHCVLAYPAPEHEVNLRAMRALEPIADAIGWSDHALGVDVAVTAVAAGARIIEKHFTLDSSRTTFRDHALSADPKTFRDMVDRIRAVERQLGDGVKRRVDAESGANAARRGAYAATALPAGHVLTAADIVWLRPAAAFTPRDAARLIGRSLTRDLNAHEPLPQLDS